MYDVIHSVINKFSGVQKNIDEIGSNVLIAIYSLINKNVPSDLPTGGVPAGVQDNIDDLMK